MTAFQPFGWPTTEEKLQHGEEISRLYPGPENLQSAELALVAWTTRNFVNVSADLDFTISLRALTGGATEATVIGRVPVASTVTSVTYIPNYPGVPEATSEKSRTLEVYNEGPGGGSETEVQIASRQFTASAQGLTPAVIALSETTKVGVGDILIAVRNGEAESPTDPGGILTVTVRPLAA